MSELIAPKQALSDDAIPAAGGWRGLVALFRRRVSALLGLLGLALVLFVAIFAPLVAPHDPLKQDTSVSLRPPAWEEGGMPEYPLGTDVLGRDIASRLIHGARYSLLIGVSAALLGSFLGLVTGLIAGYSGGWADTVLMRLGDIQLAFPFVLLAIMLLGTATDRTPLHLILVLGVPSWIIYGRVVRSRVLAERKKDYVTAAQAVGAGRVRTLVRYVLPNVWQVVPVITMLDIGYLVIVESMLSFLGFGLTPPTPSWGSILASGKQYMIVSPWLPVLPGLAILFTVLSINLTADGLADLLDPKLSRSAFGRRRTPKSSGDASEMSLDSVLLRVRNLVTEFHTEDRVVRAVRGLSFDLARGQTLGIVGESGSGKSVTALSIIQLLDATGQVVEGSVLFDGRDLLQLPEQEMATVRGQRISMIFQNPGASLNPVLTAGAQMTETLRRHRQMTKADALAEARQDLLQVGIGNPEQVLRAYPFQLSGGMNQRVMIAIAMGVQPDLLIADEPTTSLDVTTQAQIMDELRLLQRKHDTSIIYITHDIALLSGFADVILVMYAGQVCEIGPAAQVINDPQHPYTRALLDSLPRPERSGDVRLETIPGDLPDPENPPEGCPFAPRCPSVMEVCREVNPPHYAVGDGRKSACHLHADVAQVVEVT